eukprot:jgi/Hompol1/3083/HPOL_001558-RA
MMNVIDERVPHQELTHEQLEELFKRTSAFTVKSVALGIDDDELDELEMWTLEHGQELDEQLDEVESVIGGDVTWLLHSYERHLTRSCMCFVYVLLFASDYQIVDDESWERMMGSAVAPAPKISTAKTDKERERANREHKKERERVERELKRERDKMERELAKQAKERERLEQQERKRIEKAAAASKPSTSRARASSNQAATKITQATAAPSIPPVIPASTPSPAKPALPAASKYDRDALLARYKVMQVQMQDRLGNYFVMKKRVALPDPDLPTYIRIPPAPIPRAWAKRIESLKIPSIIDYGFLFIWTEKEHTPQILKAAEKWEFRYVENIAWIKKIVDNRIAKQPYRYFNRSKTTCLIFRKEGETELRHQRNADCEFDFIKPGYVDHDVGNLIASRIQKYGDTLTEPKPKFVYDVIETLLPNAVYSANNQGADQLLE